MNHTDIARPSNSILMTDVPLAADCTRLCDNVACNLSIYYAQDRMHLRESVTRRKKKIIILAVLSVPFEFFTAAFLLAFFPYTFRCCEEIEEQNAYLSNYECILWVSIVESSRSHILSRRFTYSAHSVRCVSWRFLKQLNNFALFLLQECRIAAKTHEY